MSKDLINYYLQSLKEENAIYQASQYGIHFTKEEMEVVLPLVKRNWETFLDPNSKTCMLKDIESSTSKDTMQKTEKLLSILMSNYSKSLY